MRSFILWAIMTSLGKIIYDLFIFYSVLTFFKKKSWHGLDFFL
jgi:hypothetical protein